YAWNPAIGAVLHTHSVNATVLSRLVRGDRLVLQDYELQKAFAGVTTHEGQVEVPIFDNDQDIARLASRVQPWLEAHPYCPGYLIRGHGLYTWGARMSDALRQVEAFEFLFECELKVLSLSR
ncbi:MAG: methylthioribulose 1-phosphate dehydratase, partial [Pseudomonas aeruginosa]|nr:methylthioribulose 1-phosphate dehydratase [Pseudomonas aeruginosa]